MGGIGGLALGARWLAGKAIGKNTLGWAGRGGIPEFKAGPSGVYKPPVGAAVRGGSIKRRPSRVKKGLSLTGVKSGTIPA